MTFEEIQTTIEGMLAVQRELQESQIRLTQQTQQFTEQFQQFAEQTQRQQKILDQLIGYSIIQESGQLDLQEQMLALQRRIERLENRS